MQPILRVFFSARGNFFGDEAKLDYNVIVRDNQLRINLCWPKKNGREVERLIGVYVTEDECMKKQIVF